MSTDDDTVLSMWTVYRHPLDYPDSFVARRWDIGSGVTNVTNDMFVADTLIEVRALLPPGLVCMERLPHDQPQIVEVWI